MSRPDRRVHKTRALLQEALLALVREKPYDEISIQEILDRADVGRSTFYAHYRGKHELLVSVLDRMLEAFRARRPDPAGSSADRLTWFSLPLLEHIDQHRHTSRSRMGTRGRAVLHRQVERAIERHVAVDISALATTRPPQSIPGEILARYVASTFVLVLDWWVDSADALSARQADAAFRALVRPTLDAICG